MWRPKDWSNPLKDTKEAQIFEAGADAMLQAIIQVSSDPHLWLDYWEAIKKEASCRK